MSKQSVSASIVHADDGSRTIIVFADGVLTTPVDETHPNFERIVEVCATGEYESAQDVLDLFDIPTVIERKFAQLSERVAVKDGQILLDGDVVGGPLQQQILDFVEAGEDFGPLVAFYEKLVTNPLGNVREGLYSWIEGQTANGALTITEDGDLLGYKGVHKRSPEWRTDEEVVYVPSRRGEGVVNGRDVSGYEFIEQVPGDVVEMPRSRVLNEPSRECGTGLHIGTWQYAKSFGDGTCLLVRFSPRDIVSLPDSNSSWKLRVCRYTVVDIVDECLTEQVYRTEAEPESDDLYLIDDEDDLDLTLDPPLAVGDRIVDWADDPATVTAVDESGRVDILWDNRRFGANGVGLGMDPTRLRRTSHGRGGPTSQRAKGNGRHPAQDAKGRFSAGRPGSVRDSRTGRFGG